jgi:hypothetical protein
MSSRGVHRLALGVALAAAIALGVHGVRYGTWAVGGSDSACYGLMARAFAAGRIQPSTTLASQVPWPDGPSTLAPAGFLPSRSQPNAVSPVCAPGFSLLLAPFVWLGGRNGIFLLTPLAGATLVWLSFLLGSRLAGAAAGALAAVVVATSPIVLYQVVQPMNDVMTATLWVAVVAVIAGDSPRRAWTAGLFAGVALLVRPNLLPAAVAAGLLMAASSDDGAYPRTAPPGSPLQVGGQERYRRALVRAGAFAAGVLPGVLAVAWLNARLYGSALRSGYGDLGGLFSVGFVATNAARYFLWLIETQTVFPLLALAAPWACHWSRRVAIRCAFGVAASVVAVYLLYRPFDDWWYLRFLLPAIVLGLILASGVAVAVLSRLPRPVAVTAGLLLAAVLGAAGIRTAGTHRAFALRGLEQRFRDVGLVVGDRLPPNAAFLTVWQSGTVRFYADREAISWDSLDPAWLDPAVGWLALRGYRPYIMLESWEEPGFRSRFGARADLGALDWPPAFEIDRQVRVFDPADRLRYLSGAPVITDYLWPSGPKTGRAGR